jgi:hypothetical protein
VFSPWQFNLDPAAVELLERHGWTAPAAHGYPTGAEIVELYLEPLAATPGIARSLRLGSTVVGVTRSGLDKLKDTGRDEAPFELVVDEPDGERRYLARAVIDASGTWTRPNPLGAGLPAQPASVRWPGASTTASRTRLRRGRLGGVGGGLPDARRRSPRRRARVARRRAGDRRRPRDRGHRFRPNLSLLGELRLDLDDRVEAARALAPLIDPNLHSRGSVPPHGVDELSHRTPMSTWWA